MTLSRWAMLVWMAFRDLGAHRTKTVVVGTLLAFGTFLVVTGGALLQSVSGSMQKSITSSLTGDIQVYSATAEDELQLFGGGMSMSPDIGEIDDWGPVRDALLQVDNVATVVPMGITVGQVFGDSELDVVLDGLRDAVDQGDEAAREAEIEHLRMIAASLEEDTKKQEALVADVEEVRGNLADLQRIQQDDFWQDFRADPVAGFDFLDTRIASLSVEGGFYFMRCIGTDMEAYTRSFDRFRIVEGEAIPQGRRGILMSERYHETAAKNRVARELDAIRQAMEDDQVTLADDATLRNRIEANSKQYQRVLFQLSPADGRDLAQELRELLGRPADEGTLAELLQDFLHMEDDSFEPRYAWFYEHIAPRIRLYEFQPGDVLTVYGQTKTGYQRAVNVKLWGIYQFSGLERSDLAGAGQLIDLITFRALYGKMTDEQKAELADIRASVGLQEVTRDSVEDDLFGGPAPDPDPQPEDTLPDQDAVSGFDAFGEDGDLQLHADGDRLDDRVYSPAEMTEGLVLNAAVVLDDPSRIRQTMAAITAKSDELDLGIQAIDWQQASGIVGQLIMVLQGIVTVAIVIVFVVTLVIINNTMVMTTMDRTGEIGTMRAIGAQRGFVIWLFLLETLILGALSGAVGGGLSLLFVGWLGQVGIPAVEDVLVIMFAGPRLYPSVSLLNIVFGMVAVLLISGLSTLYPAALAAGVRPVVAMQGKD